jgi:hypothetical protein
VYLPYHLNGFPLYKLWRNLNIFFLNIPGPDNKVGDLTVLHWIARSVRNKIEYLERICLGSSIVCITESHLDDKASTQDSKV